MEELGMVAVNIYIGSAPTFFGTKTATQIDVVFMPKTLLGDVTSAGSLRRLGRDLHTGYLYGAGARSRA
eukprot:6462183-Pyramimonas_sp.AAC.1